jgi:hypothetical protein
MSWQVDEMSVGEMTCCQTVSISGIALQDFFEYLKQRLSKLVFITREAFLNSLIFSGKAQSLPLKWSTYRTNTIFQPSLVFSGAESPYTCFTQ